MKAMIFAAGVGKRLYPLTKDKPKALVEVNGVPLLELVVKRLKLYGVNEIVVNVHHHAAQIVDFLKKKNNFDILIELSDETELLLDTGGGLKKAAWFFNDNKPFLVHNVDVLSDIDIMDLYNKHIEFNALATLATRRRESERHFLFYYNNNEELLGGWENEKDEDLIIVKRSKALKPLAFSGIQILSPSIFNLIIENDVFSIRDVYLRLAKKHKIVSYDHTSSKWMDLGRPEHLDSAVNILGKDFFNIIT